MSWKRNVLVVANVTAASEELAVALKERAEQNPSSFTVIVPATPWAGGRSASQAKLSEAVQQLLSLGLEVDGVVSDPDPFVAVAEAWDPRKYDEIIISTLPEGSSRWLHAGLPERIARLTGAPVSHVVSQPAKPAVKTESAPTHEKTPMGPLSVLGWGGATKR